ncbi:hypothetical protein D9M71_705600 [compost metagenome]
MVFHLGADGAEVDEPVFEQGTGHGLQGLVAAAVEFDLVVQRSEDVGDGALFLNGRNRHFQLIKCLTSKVLDSGACEEWLKPASAACQHEPIEQVVIV